MSDILTHKELVAPAFLPEEDAPEKPRKREEKPLGEELADALVAGLERRGWTIEYRWTTYDGHAFDARRKDIRYDVEVKSLDRGPREGWTGHWALTATRRSGLFKRLWPGRYDADEHALLRLHLDEVLAGDPRIASSGVWWTEKDFEAQRGASAQTV